MIRLVILILMIAGHLQAQVSDSTNASEPAKSYSFGKNAQGFIEVNTQKQITYKTTGFKNTEIFDKIVYLESEECEALRKRDTLRLISLWARDFTLDETQSLVSSKGGIPFYTGLYRMVEAVTPVDSLTVMCTGIEYQNQIGTYHTEGTQKKKFFHIWTNYNGVWKLTTKRNELVDD